MTVASTTTVIIVKNVYQTRHQLHTLFFHHIALNDHLMLLTKANYKKLYSDENQVNLLMQSFYLFLFFQTISKQH